MGDAGKIENLREICQEADALVIEATYLESESELAEQFGHLTATEAAVLARDAKVGGLILTHISRRYREEQVLEEARKTFENVYVAKDFDRYQIKRGEIIKG